MFLTQSAALQSLMVQYVHLGVSIALIGLTTANGGGARARAWGLSLAVLGLAIMVYIWLKFDTLIGAQDFLRHTTW